MTILAVALAAFGAGMIAGRRTAPDRATGPAIGAELRTLMEQHAEKSGAPS